MKIYFGSRVPDYVLDPFYPEYVFPLMVRMMANLRKSHSSSFQPAFGLLAWVLVTGSIVGAANTPIAEEAATDRPFPNVVLILSDDQAWSDYQFTGHPHIRTPNLDRLAKESLTFKRGYVPDSLCRPSLVSIITGLYPHQHGIVGNDPPWPLGDDGTRKPIGQSHPSYLPVRAAYIDKVDSLNTLADRLGERGYLSLQTGKWWEGNYSRGGFTHGMTHGDMVRGGRHGDDGLRIGREGFEPVTEFLDEVQAKGKPFLLWYAPMMPHTPHNPPKRLLDYYRTKTDSLPMAKYWAMCEWFDETCGQLLGILEDRKLQDNTIVLYVTDNGWINDPSASRYAPRSKRSPNEGGIRTPIMVHWPGHVEPRVEVEHLASSIDLVPTVLSLVGIDADPTLPGIDLTNRDQVAARDYVFGEIFEHDIVDMEDEAASLMYRWIVGDRWKLIVPDPDRCPEEKVELYDLREDPAETKNLAGQHPDVVAELRQQIDRWWNPKG